VRAELRALFGAALQAAYPGTTEEPLVVATANAKFGDYQCNNAMGLFGRMKGKVTQSCLRANCH
jgi:arginyl-tRNA synthetase